MDCGLPFFANRPLDAHARAASRKTIAEVLAKDRQVLETDRTAALLTENNQLARLHDQLAAANLGRQSQGGSALTSRSTISSQLFEAKILMFPV
jgi:hypothetical protein